MSQSIFAFVCMHLCKHLFCKENNLLYDLSYSQQTQLNTNPNIISTDLCVDKNVLQKYLKYLHILTRLGSYWGRQRLSIVTLHILMSNG